MNNTRLDRFWTLTVFFLVAIIIAGSVLAWVRHSPGKPIAISLASSQVFPGKIYIGGAVTSPGYYPLNPKDSIEALIQAAGGTTGSANPDDLRLYMPEAGGEREGQRVDINRAEAWLLEALPGIGEGLAQRIIDYRRQNGLFRNIREITRVAGIGEGLYEKIKDLITVAE